MMLLMLAQDAAGTAASEPNATYFLWGCILFGVALVLLVLELGVPSGGLIGILAGVAAVSSIVAFFMYDPWWGGLAALLYIVLAPILIIFLFKVWLHSPIAKMMILGDNTPNPSTDEETAAETERQRSERLAEIRALIGAEGVTETALRPVGTVRIKGQRVDGLAESGIIEANTPIIVVDVYDNQIKVRPR
jgi:membrane-bound serine protease (ClpP class)